MSVLAYAGNKASRSILRRQIPTHAIVVTSYDILRNDIDDLSQVYWNYCVLDEGHVIRNAKSRNTQVKTSHHVLCSAMTDG